MSLETVEFRSSIQPGRAMVVLNPEAGHGTLRRKTEYTRRAEDRLRLRGWDVTSRNTKRSGHEVRFAEEAVRDGFDAVFTAGGDGTAQHMLQVLTGSKTTLGVLPRGSINLWPRETGIPKSPEQAIDAQLLGEVRQIDVGVVNDSHYFRTTAGFGFDGAILNRLSRLQDSDGRRKIRGAPLYFATCVLKYPSAEATEAAISVGTESFTTSMFQTWIGNSRLLGYMELRPEGRIDDGKLEVTVFPKLGPTEFATNAGIALKNYIRTRSGGRVPGASYCRGATTTIITKRQVHAQIDGELMPGGPSNEYTIKTRPQALRVFVPPTEAALSLFGQAA